MPAPLRTSTWSNKHCHDDHLVPLQPVCVHQVSHQRALSTGSSLQCKILFCVPLKLGSPFLQYARHLTDFIHLSLFVYFHISIISMDWLIACFFCLFLWYKTKTLSNCLFKVHLLKWKQYTYYCCFTFQCMASRVTAHRHTKKYTYPSEWQAAQQSVRKWCRIKSWCLINCKYVFVHYWQTANLVSTDSDIGAK